MDPNTNLDEQLMISDRILAGESVGSPEITRLAELIRALDRWICNGGFLPLAWDEPEQDPIDPRDETELRDDYWKARMISKLNKEA